MSISPIFSFALFLLPSGLGKFYYYFPKRPLFGRRFFSSFSCLFPKLKKNFFLIFYGYGPAVRGPEMCSAGAEMDGVGPVRWPPPCGRCARPHAVEPRAPRACATPPWCFPGNFFEIFFILI